MKIKEFQHRPVKPDTYEASMALNQLMRIGKHAIKLHNMIDDAAEMESWVAKKIDLAGDYVKKVYNYTEGEKAGLYDDGGMTEDDNSDYIKQAYMLAVKHHTDGSGDGNINEDIGDLIEDYNEKATKKISPEQIMRISKKYNAGGDYVEVLSAEGIDGKLWLEVAKEYYSQLESVSEDEDKKTVIHSITPGSEKEKGMMQAAIFQGGKRTDVLAATPKDLADQYIKNGVNYNDFNFLHTSDVDFPEEDDGWNNEKYGNDAHGFIQDALKILKNYKGESVSEDAGDQEKMQGLLQWFKNKYDTYRKDFIDDQIENGIRGSQLEQAVENNDELVELENIIDALKSGSMKDAIEEINRAKYEFSGIPGDGDDFMQVIEKLGIPKDTFYFTKDESLEARLEAKLSEDAGEGHMSKSTLYHTAKYAIALMQMIKPGDDLEGWVQSKLNKAADYLQGVYNYEEYQKLNPYREELDASLMQKHAQVVQKNIDEILAKETKLDDIDTKPGMMRILAKRVNEVEKEIAKETRKKTNEDGHTDVPSAIRNCETIIEDAMQMKQKLQTMEGELPSWMTQMIAVAASDLNDARDYLLNPTTESGILYRAGVKKYGKAGMKAIQSAAGKGASHQEIGKIKDKHLKDAEDLEEGLKDWARNLAAAGVIVGAVAGIGSIQKAIDNTVPAVKAMNTAYEMAMDAGNKELAKNIKNDISAVKVRLDSGRDLDFVKAMQEKYAKFIQTEGLAYESRLQVQLNQQLK